MRCETYLFKPVKLVGPSAILSVRIKRPQHLALMIDGTKEMSVGHGGRVHDAQGFTMKRIWQTFRRGYRRKI